MAKRKQKVSLINVLEEVISAKTMLLLDESGSPIVAFALEQLIKAQEYIAQLLEQNGDN